MTNSSAPRVDVSRLDSQTTVGERDLERIIERALELDETTASRLTLARVREISIELGIRPESVEQAFGEHILAEPTRRAMVVVESAGLRSIRRRLVISATVFATSASVLALWQATTDTFSEELLPWIFGVIGVAIPLALAATIRVAKGGRDSE
jgi:hypothetical protein